MKRQITALGIILALNLSVAITRIVLHVLTGSSSILADAIHAFSDSGANIVAIFGIWLAARPAHEAHPYGHKRFEPLAVVIIGLMVFAGGVVVAQQGIEKLISGSAVVFSPIAFWLLVGTLVLNALIASIERFLGKRWQSRLLKADATHTVSDLFAGGAVLVGYGALKIGVSVLDPLAALAIAGLIIFIAVRELIWENIQILIDAKVFDEQEIRTVVEKIPGVIECHHIRSRGTAEDPFIDLHIRVKAHTTIENAYPIVQTVRKALEEKLRADATIQVEPEL
ncbi:MAG: hypothetical protein A2806_02190 [Candidatus Terrybacteria bacterium RIFCSPHIGHO2_01_FULL_48_17]|uniref:Uncharacterized protein n=1 Tax=Candidatus Terrybacteria bacterium RIFCSPHIGHO2_01_FULL_48_17 TaxID=1802362 RepID=A0A1G2PHT6_9BACT|nr:MAG: hypothetical protein A2806_02190 [Candidatus Terrybacteria bacterium RIFCSPHIGHO2_01_FULL_48_17]OHA53559.1 MAG: hypothetical protein A3A30_00145 [Candidatus Terrybacteria bacterium RIFCSPLOWO2_01_FULL_48_14]